MLSFMYGVYSSLFVEHTYKVLVIGLESSGKTTLVEQMKCLYAEPKGTGGAGAPKPSPADEIAKVRIQPTVGLNVSRLTHRTAPRAATADDLRNGAEKAKSLSLSAFPSSSSISSLSASTARGAFAAAETNAAPALTSLMIWDVGGSLRSLWANYFSACHAVVFVVDSTLGAAPNSNAESNSNSNADAKSNSNAESNSNSNAESNSNSNADAKSKSNFRRGAFVETAAVLRAVFRHPLLADAPLLILSNKSDAAGHCALAALQDALGLVEMALMPAAYANDDENEKENEKNRSDDKCGGAGGNGEPTEESRFSAAARTAGGGGTSGIGKKIMRIMEVSARDGTGLQEAMDWLVRQLRESKRVSEEVDG